MLKTASRVSEWDEFAAAFPGAPPLAEAVERISAGALPDACRRLLDHRNHMTATLEGFHGAPLTIRVLGRAREAESYTRMIALLREDTGAAVQFAFARSRLDLLPAGMREAILAEAIPLGQILAASGMVWQIEVSAFLKVMPGSGLAHILAGPPGRESYGRIAGLSSGGQAAFEVIELLPPALAG